MAVDAITAVASALDDVTKEITQHEQIANSPAMQKALVVHRFQAVLDGFRADISNEDYEKLVQMVAAPNAAGA